MLLIHNTTETYTNSNAISNLNPLTYNNNNKKCCLDISNTNVDPIAYNDFCNTVIDPSHNYNTPDEYNKYCSSELQLIPNREYAINKATIPDAPVALTPPTPITITMATRR